MLLTPNPVGGADVRWTGSFIEGLPGTGPVMLIFLRGVVRFLARLLVKAAERDWSTPASLGAAFLRPQPSGRHIATTVRFGLMSSVGAAGRRFGLFSGLGGNAGRGVADGR